MQDIKSSTSCHDGDNTVKNKQGHKLYNLLRGLHSSKESQCQDGLFVEFNPKGF